MKTLYVSDLDGTLLNNRQEISSESLSVLNRLLNQGVLFTVATARSYESASKLLTGLRLSLPIIFINGVFIYDPVLGTNIREHYLDRTAAEEIMRTYEAHRLEPIVYTIDKAGHPRVYYRGIRNASEELYFGSRLRSGDQRFRQVSDYRDCMDESIMMINAIDTDRALAPAYELLRGRANAVCHYGPDVYAPDYHWLEIGSPRATKREAVLHVKGLLQADRLVCFGDNLNDLSMFEAADEKYAVANAHELVKQAATAMISSNEDHGVARFLERRYL